MNRLSEQLIMLSVLGTPLCFIVAIVLETGDGVTARELADRMDMAGTSVIKQGLERACSRGWIYKTPELRKRGSVYAMTARGQELKNKLLCKQDTR